MHSASNKELSMKEGGGEVLFHGGSNDFHHFQRDDHGVYNTATNEATLCQDEHTLNRSYYKHMPSHEKREIDICGNSKALRGSKSFVTNINYGSKGSFDFHRNVKDANYKPNSSYGNALHPNWAAPWAESWSYDMQTTKEGKEAFHRHSYDSTAIQSKFHAFGEGGTGYSCIPNKDGHFTYKSDHTHSSYRQMERSISLALPSDGQNLNPLQTFVRLRCIEAFAVTSSFALTRTKGRGGKVKNGQVGLRCIYCKHVASTEQANQAVSFPSSLEMLYESVRNWQRFHLSKCSHIPDDILEQYSKLRSTSLHSKSVDSSLKKRNTRLKTRFYFKSSAEAVGLVNIPNGNGICFHDEVNSIMLHSVVKQNALAKDHEDHSQLSSTQQSETNHGLCTAEDSRLLMEAINHPRGIVQANDQYLVTDFMFLLFSQLRRTKLCAIRDHGKHRVHEPGFPGLECRHCAKLEGKKGRYFPRASRGLSGKLLQKLFLMKHLWTLTTNNILQTQVSHWLRFLTS